MEVNLLIQGSPESDVEVAKPKKKNKPLMANESSASESDSEVDKEEEPLLNMIITILY